MRVSVEDLVGTVRRHPRAALAAVVLVALVAAGSCARYVSVTGERAREAAQEASRPDTGSADGAGASEGTAAGAGKGSAARPTAAQEKLEKGYGEDERALADLLAGRVWTAGSGATAEFSADLSLTVDGGEPRALAVADLASTAVADGEPSWAASLLLPDGSSAVLSIQTTTDQQGRETVLLTSPGLLGDSVFEGTVRPSDVKVEIKDEGSLEGMGVDVDDLEKAVSDWAGKKAPTAETAVAARSVDADFEHREVDVYFTLDDASSTRAVAMCDLKTGKIEVEEDTSWTSR